LIASGAVIVRRDADNVPLTAGNQTLLRGTIRAGCVAHPLWLATVSLIHHFLKSSVLLNDKALADESEDRPFLLYCEDAC
jgi:hypothetical protein